MKANLFKILLILSFLFFFSSLVLGADFFDDFGLRPLGMGGAFTAVSGDLAAIFYNPAGLTESGTQFLSSVYDLNKYQFAQKEGWTAGYGSLAYGQYLVREKNDNLTRCYLYSLAFPLGDLGQAGITYKKIDFVSWGKIGWVWNFGFKKALLENWSWGVVFKNIFKDKLELPMTIRTGLAYYWDKNNLLAGDLEVPVSELKNLKSYRMFYGWESKSSENITYRLGWSQAGFSAGASLVFLPVVLEYLLVKSPGKSETIQSFGIKLVSS